GDRDRLDRVERLDGGGALLVVEHRELAEDISGPEVGERDGPAVDVLAHGPGVAAADDVAGVARVALAEDHLLGREPPQDRDVRDAAQVLRCQLREDGHLLEQPDDLLRSGHPEESLCASGVGPEAPGYGAGAMTRAIVLASLIVVCVL